MKNTLKEFSLKKMIFQPQFAKKFCCMFFGILFMGFFLSFLIKINWGTDPASFHNKTISLALGWTFGNWQLLYNTACFVIVLLINCKLIGLGTFFNWVLIGYTADFFCWLWDRTIPAAIFSTNEYLALKLAIFVLALLLFVNAVLVFSLILIWFSTLLSLALTASITSSITTIFFTPSTSTRMAKEIYGHS